MGYGASSYPANVAPAAVVDAVSVPPATVPDDVLEKKYQIRKVILLRNIYPGVDELAGSEEVELDLQRSPLINRGKRPGWWELARTCSLLSQRMSRADW